MFKVETSKIIKFYNEFAIVILSGQIMMIMMRPSIFVMVMLWLVSIGLYLVGKDQVSDGVKKFARVVIHMNHLLFGWGVCSYVGKALEKALGEKGSTGVLSFLLGLFIFFVYLTLITNKKTMLIVEKINHLSCGFFGKQNVATKEQGDVRLGTDVETGEDVVLPWSDRFLHMLVLGSTGTGKTSQILTPMIYQDMQNLNCGITILEPKSDLAEKAYMLAKHLGRKVQYFNPTLKNCPYFNPLYGPMEIVIENMATTFGMFDADSSSYFRDMSDTLVRNGIRVIKTLKGNNATLVDFATLLFNPEGQGKNLVIEFKRAKTINSEMKKQNDDIASWFLNEYFNEKSKAYEHTSSLRTRVNKLVSNQFLRRTLNPPPNTPREMMIDFDAHLAGTGVLTMATEQGVLGQLGDFLGFFLVLSLQSSVLKRPGSVDTRIPHFCFIDEVQVFANSGFSNLLTQGRSYRISMNLATQALDQLGMNSGRNGAAFIQLVTTNARNIVLFPGCSGKDARFYSEQFGDTEVTEVSKSTSSQKKIWGNKGFFTPARETLSERTSRKSLFTPADLIFKEFGEVTMRLIKHNTVQYPQVVKVSYIPKDLNDMLDEQILIYKEEEKYTPEEMECEDLSNLGNEEIGEDLLIGLDELKANGEAVVQGEIPDDYPEEDYEEVVEDLL